MILLVMSTSLSAQNQVKAKLENPITEAYLKQHLRKQSPRLILTPDIEKVLKERLKSDPLVQSYHRYLQKDAQDILKEPLTQHTLEGFRMLPAFEMPHRLGVLAMVYRLDKNPEVLKRINEELLTVSSFADWNPQHFLDVSQMSLAVALAIDWTGDALPKETVKLAKNAIIEKGLLPSYNVNGERMGWIDGVNNWNSVCHGGMVAAALAIAEVNPALATKTIARALEKLPNSLKEYAPDGAYPEGPGYWRFGTSFSVIASNVLTTALGQDFGVAASQGFLGSADFRLQMTGPTGECFNFADSDSRMDGETMVLMAWFASQTGNGLYLNKPFFEKPYGGARLAGPGIVWLSQFSQKKTTELTPEWLGRGANPVAVFHGEPNDPNRLFLAFKGGAASISHGNMDAGTFVFELNGVRWVIDPGNQNYYLLNKIGFQLSNYTQQSERWSLLTKSNLTHSTITANDARFKVNVMAPISDFKKGSQPEATIDMTKVLNGLITSLERKFIKESNQSVLIEDRFEVNDSTQFITWGMMTVADVLPTKNGAVLKQDGKELKLTILSPDHLAVSIISLDPAPLSIDKNIKNLKRIEVKVPAYLLKDKKGMIQIRLSGI